MIQLFLSLIAGNCAAYSVNADKGRPWTTLSTCLTVKFDGSLVRLLEADNDAVQPTYWNDYTIQMQKQSQKPSRIHPMKQLEALQQTVLQQL